MVTSCGYSSGQQVQSVRQPMDWSRFYQRLLRRSQIPRSGDPPTTFFDRGFEKSSQGLQGTFNSTLGLPWVPLVSALERDFSSSPSLAFYSWGDLGHIVTQNSINLLLEPKRFRPQNPASAGVRSTWFEVLGSHRPCG